MNNGRQTQLPIVEEFYSLQGEGANAGMAAWFIRLGGCDVGCGWCDSKHAWSAAAGRMTEVGDIVAKVVAAGAKTAVITGGEPTMHDLQPLTEELHRQGIKILLETSGTHPLRGEFDWICLSPKRAKEPSDEAFARADELKVVIAEAADFAWAEECAARTRSGCLLFLQPEWSVRGEAMPLIAEYAKEHPEWRASLQIHKFMNIP